jgi:glucose/mannose-6-phosphate isomerase
MNLDDLAIYPTIDLENMYAQIDGLPDQLLNAWILGNTLELPDWQGIRQVVLCGMGGSAIGADLLAAYLTPTCRVPVTVHRDYGLPGWARGSETLVFACSHSGSTEETLSAFEEAHAQGCRLLSICTGGQLAEMAANTQTPVWRFQHIGQPRAAVGYSFGMLLAALRRLQFIQDPSAELQGAVGAMKQQQVELQVDVPVIKNPAKRIAGQLMGRWVTVFGAGFLAPVARRWKGQINELAKAWAQFEFFPEANHNTISGLLQPEEQLMRMVGIFLRSRHDDPRHRARTSLTRKMFLLEGIGADYIEAQGDSPLANMWTLLLYGDYTAYYLAIAYGIDPTPVDLIQDFKKELQAVRAAK